MATATPNSTSTTITFVVKGSGSAGISVELDDDLNLQKTQFESNDTVYFKVFCNPSTMIVDAFTSDGTVVIGADQTTEISEQVVFAKVTSANLSKVAIGALTSFKWLGSQTANLGAVTASSAGTTITTKDESIGVCNVVYNASYKAGNLSGVVMPKDLTDYPVVIVLLGTLPTTP